MVVIFISLSEKKAKLKTEKVLDLYADRIGNQTWKTNITKEGLIAIKSHLSKTASKNTSVACHLVHKAKNTELLWIVGSRLKFNFDGIVPIATTKRNSVSYLAKLIDYLSSSNHKKPILYNESKEKSFL